MYIAIWKNHIGKEIISFLSDENTEDLNKFRNMQGAKILYTTTDINDFMKVLGPRV